MKKTLKNLIVITALFCSYNFTVLAETKTFNTVTKALNYTGNKATVKKVIITGKISGSDYSASSEWSKFRTLDTTFSNIEAVEILTNQDIPDYDTTNRCSLFYLREQTMELKWLKNFSAPNVKYIGKRAFYECSNLTTVNFPSVKTIENRTFWGCKNLTTVNFPLVTTIGNNTFYKCSNLTSVKFPLVTTIGNNAFSDCENLTSINFPSVTTIKEDAFYGCENLTTVNFPSITSIEEDAFSGCKNLVSATFGTGFKTKTEIQFGKKVFFNVKTENIDLILGKYVLPLPDLNLKIWQNDNFVNNKDYIWKSIKIKDK